MVGGRILASGVNLTTCFLCLQLLQLPSDSESTEFCLAESFLAHCSESEVIVMETANFGRMELGRCVTRNYGYLGCSVDVLGHLDAVCSGQRSCELSVSDPILVRTKPCPPDFSSYLEATYRCVPVETMQPKVTCRENRYHVIRNGRGFIAGPASDVSGGDDDDGLCVLVFNVPNGQRLNITLIDFAARNPFETIDPLAPRDTDQSRHDTPSRATHDDDHRSSTTRALPQSPTNRPPPKDRSPGGGGDHLPSSRFKPVSAVQKVACQQYAVIREPATGLSVPVCGGGGGGGGGAQARERHVYLSRSNFVHLQLLTWPQVNGAPTGAHNFGRIHHFQPAKYLLQYEVVGCPTYTALPDGAHARYEGDRLIVWCNQSRQSAKIFTCAGGNWVGDPHNCTSGRTDLKLSGEEGFSKDLITLPPFGLSLLIIVGVALVVVVYISITIVFIMCIRRRRRRMTRAEINTEPASKPPPETDRCHKAASPVDPAAAVGGGRRSGGDHLLLPFPPGRMIFRLEEECIPMLDAPPPPPPPPHLILDTTGGRRASGHVCPACLEAKEAAAAAQAAATAAVEPLYVRASNGGGTPAPPPPVLLGCAVAPTTVGAELADRTMGRNRSRLMGGCPSVPQ